MTSPRPTDLNFALPPGFVPTIRPVPAPAAPAQVETSEPAVERKPRAPRKPRATTAKPAAPKITAAKPAVAPRTTTAKPATAKIPTAKPAPKTAPRPRTTPAVAEIVEQEAGRILEDAARTAADMLAAARSTAARLNAELAAEQEQRRREMEDAVADLADYLDALAHRLRSGAVPSMG